ncbi:siderophore-interacting protein [Aurantimonas endophytica]|uniref:NADPH-dependent ferric siderophore reductase n=1 Tax=Aurantimonas endophytica TaxID=1522175 RepID=A0A7W6HEE3_9HYPH|nr:siderophore-interacting protein [Aurantimonas endophytica]MBB4003562.1 NADPH-dependent ferric siderophore reductase [Aurantimonas endophytica]MCO6404420.1 SIP domain-containing protein [Aurantimonas endophytica]
MVALAAADGEAAPARFVAFLSMTMDEAARFVDSVAEQLPDEVSRPVAPGAELRIAYYGGVARLAYRETLVTATAAADDLGALASLKHLVAYNIRAFLGDAADITWQGDGCETGELPQFREMRVVSAVDLTPRMRRVRLTGSDLGRFAAGGLHVRLLFPPQGRRPVWPCADRSGIPAWPEGEDRLTARTYTIRSIDLGAATVDIDVVLHEGSSPGSDWARTAEPGSIVGMMGPGGGELAPAERYLLAGDETALPAIARMLESLPVDAAGTAMIEVQDAAEIQALAHPAGFEIVWLDRGGRAAGTTDLLQAAVTSLAWPGEPGSFVYVAGELAAFKAIRDHCRKVWRLKRSAHLVGAYWRRGRRDDDPAASGDAG